MSTPHATPEALKAPKNLAWPLGWTVRHVRETGSTNADLIEYCAVGEQAWPDRSVLVADHQTAGRGRLGRGWEAPAGANLLATALFRRSDGHLHALTQKIGLAIVQAVREVARLGALEQVTLKWPNDVLLAGRKLSGVLAQVCLDAENDVVAVAVGFGVNVGWCPDDAAKVGDFVTPHQLLAGVLQKFDDLDALDPAQFHAMYKSNLATLGERVRVDLPTGESITGTAVDVATDGELKLVDACALTHLISAGDVIHLRPAP